MSSRRSFLRTAALAGSGSLFAPSIHTGRFRLSAQAPADVTARAIDLVRRSTVVDLLGLLTLDWRKWSHWVSNPAAFAPADLDRIRASGITVFHLAVSLPGPAACAATRGWLAGCRRFLAWHGEHFLEIRNLAELAQAKQTGKIGILLGMQDSCHFARPGDVPQFRALGQMSSQLTYNERNRIGCGCRAACDNGLSPFGRSIVEAMNEVRMVVDLSHCGERTTLEGIEAAGPNALITHTNCRALAPHPRAKTDEALQKLAAAGGLVGITGIRSFVRRQEPVTINNVLDHFDYAARLIGVEHVALGSDAGVDERNPTLVPGLDGPDRVYRLAEGLLRRGYSDGDVGLMLGGNALRVLAGRGTELRLPDPPELGPPAAGVTEPPVKLPVPAEAR
jgi:membrane dipeptidase